MKDEVFGFRNSSGPGCQYVEAKWTAVSGNASMPGTHSFDLDTTALIKKVSIEILIIYLRRVHIRLKAGDDFQMSSSTSNF